MKSFFIKYGRLLLLVASICAVFIIRTALAKNEASPRLDNLFTAITVLGSLVVMINGYRRLNSGDWIVALILGCVVGVSMSFATLFTPYPFFGIVRDNFGQAIVRGFGTTLVALGGLVIMRQGGPVQFRLANREWRNFGKSLVLGLVVGIPFAVLNIYALKFSQGQSIDWQNPLAAIMDALQPGIVEEIIYRFAFLGLLWAALRKPLPDQAAWLSGVLVLLVHNFIHFDDLFVQAPLVALGMGLVMAILWGLPTTLLALKRDSRFSHCLSLVTGCFAFPSRVLILNLKTKENYYGNHYFLHRFSHRGNPGGILLPNKMPPGKS